MICKSENKAGFDFPQPIYYLSGKTFNQYTNCGADTWALSIWTKAYWQYVDKIKPSPIMRLPGVDINYYNN